MTRLRFRGPAAVTLVLVLAVIQPAIAQAPEPASPRSLPSSTADSADRSYKIYSLNDFGTDPGLCEWIAQTIPEVIAAGSWHRPATIRYYAPKNILVVSHTSAVHAQVDGFLKDVKKSLSEKTKTRASAPKSHASAGGEVVPAAYHKPELHKAVKMAPEPSLSYPVPAQTKAPKHLFHFIIRYEGEGIVDDNVVKTMKDYYRAMNEAGQRTTESTPAGGAPPVSASVPSSTPQGNGRPLSVYGAVPTTDSSSDPSTSPVKEKEEKKDEKSTEKEKQTR
jgi:hypothetical protein